MRSGPAFIVDFWMSEATPHWGIVWAGGTTGGEGDSRMDAIEAATAKLTELARAPWRVAPTDEHDGA